MSLSFCLTGVDNYDSAIECATAYGKEGVARLLHSRRDGKIEVDCKGGLEDEYGMLLDSRVGHIQGVLSLIF
jgi:hypothetical protein